MVQSQKCIDTLVAWNQKQRFKKAKRLIEAKPKWRCEERMNKKEYKAYVEKYLELDEDRPTLDQTKIGLQMYKELTRQAETASDEAAILIIMEKANAYATALDEDATDSADTTDPKHED